MKRLNRSSKRVALSPNRKSLGKKKKTKPEIEESLEKSTAREEKKYLLDVSKEADSITVWISTEEKKKKQCINTLFFFPLT